MNTFKNISIKILILTIPFILSPFVNQASVTPTPKEWLEYPSRPPETVIKFATLAPEGSTWMKIMHEWNTELIESFINGVKTNRAYLEATNKLPKKPIFEDSVKHASAPNSQV